MSGLLRRIKRSRPADAGEPLPEGTAAAPEGAAPATEPPPTPAVPLADPSVPAGVDPAAAPLRPPAGRRGRLRRRLRYLRRARELMLRDLGGLLYEVHRTGGGNVDAYGNVVGAKVQRIAGLDAEAHALEAALGAPRAEAVVFQPGVGGTCEACGDLYGSGARFCASCGRPIGATAEPAAPVATRAAVLGHGADAKERPTQVLATSPDPAAAPEPPPREAETAVHGADAPAAPEPAATADTDANPAGTPERAPEEPGAVAPEPERPGREEGSPHSPSALGNGRPDDEAPPERSPGDPLSSRDTRP